MDRFNLVGPARSTPAGSKLASLFASRRFWAAIASLAVVALQGVLPFSPEQITQVVLLIGTWIVGDSLRSTV